MSRSWLDLIQSLSSYLAAYSPRRCWLAEYSLLGHIFWSGIFLAGSALGFKLESYKPWKKVLRLETAAIGALALFLHISTATVLWLDPHRGNENIPGFGLLGSVVWLGLFAALPLAPAQLGLSVGTLTSTLWHQRPSLITVGSLVVALYLAWIQPWAGYIIFD